MNRGFRLSVFLSLFSGALWFSTPARAIDGIYLGGQVGFMGLTDPPDILYNNALGFGVDLGLRTNALVDLVFSFQTSSFGANSSAPFPVNGSLTLYSQSLSADFHVGRAYDFDFTLGAGPGFYVFKSSLGSNTNFGFNFGGAVDLLVDDHFKIGMGTRYYALFGTNAISGSFWNVMMRVGYLFDLD